MGWMLADSFTLPGPSGGSCCHRTPPCICTSLQIWLYKGKLGLQYAPMYSACVGLLAKHTPRRSAPPIWVTWLSPFSWHQTWLFDQSYLTPESKCCLSYAFKARPGTQQIPARENASQGDTGWLVFVWKRTPTQVSFSHGKHLQSWDVLD